MRDLTLSQEYLLCAVNEKGRLPHLGVERTVCLVAAALLELQLEGCVAVDKKYVTVTGPLPEGQAHLRPLYAFVNRPKPIRKEKLLEEYTYTVTDAQRDELLESIGRSLADLGLVQPVKVGLLGKKKGYAPTPEAISGVVDMIRAELLEEGEITVNQASLTGESVPVAKRRGGAVYAGTVVEEGECVLEVKQATGQSRYDQIVEMIQRSEQMKSAAEAKASNLADKLVPYTFAGSLVSLALTRNVTRALSVLMVDFSCALKLAMPLAVISAMREAGREHITVKGGKFLEAVAKADTIVFDKTGTLTHACPRVAKIFTFNGKIENEMLRLAACLEEHFPHSMANAVVEEAKRRGLHHEERHAKVEYLVAHGIASSVDGEQVRIGSAHFIFEDEKCVIPEEERAKFDALPPEYSQLYLAINGVLSAVICISDPLREEAREVLSALRVLGVRNAVMLTGDSPRTAAAIAEQLGVDAFRAGVLPADKAEYVAALRKEGHTVLMVGDGINDSPALSEADAGIAISDGAAIAREIADITIAADSLWELVRLRQLAMALMRRIRNNYRFVIGFNGALIGLGVTGILPPTTSAMLHNLSTLGVSLHSMTALPMAGQETEARKDL